MNDQAPLPGPRNSGADEVQTPDAGAQDGHPSSGWQRLWRRLRGGSNGSARETLEEIIEERAEAEEPIGDDERLLLRNILELRGRTVGEVMVPRADVLAVDAGTPRSEIVDIIARAGHSRLPVFRGNLDDAIGMVHIKDLLVWQGRESEFDLSNLLRRVLFVAPSMEVLELLLEMRVNRSHMALVVDEFGGVDGLVTIEDLVEEIVGEIEDEHDRTADPILAANTDGTFTADARVTIDALEEKLGVFADDDERDDIDTVGGLVFSLAGRVPVRGELVNHPSGLEFEVIESDPRRIHRVHIRQPQKGPDKSDNETAVTGKTGADEDSTGKPDTDDGPTSGTSGGG